jgi:hypothetical protein
VRPSKNLGELLDYHRNKLTFLKEFELKDQIEKLRLEQDQLKKYDEMDVDLDDQDILINYLNFIKKHFQEKMNIYDREKAKQNSLHNNDIDMLEKQIIYLDKRDIITIENSIECSKVRAEEDEDVAVAEELIEKKFEHETEVKMKQNRDYFDNVKLKEIRFIDRVTSELQFQKHDIINEELKGQQKLKRKEKKRKKTFEYVTIFDNVIEIATERLSKKNENDAKSDFENAMKTIINEANNFTVNMLKNIDRVAVNSDSIRFNLEKAFQNLQISEEKIANLNVGKKLAQGNKIKHLFETNISLAKQNNHLMNKLNEYQSKYYNTVLDDMVKCDNPDDFITKKDKIDRFKNQLQVPDLFNVNESFFTVNFDESFNY